VPSVRRRRTVVAPLAAVSAVLMVVAPACGDDDSDDGAAPVDAEVTSVCAPRVGERGPDGGVAPTTGPAGDAALAELVAGAFCATYTFGSGDDAFTASPVPVLPAAEATCIGSGLVARLGADRVRALAIAAAPWHLLGFALAHNAGSPQPLERADAEAVVDTFADCTDRWEELLVRSVTEGSDQIGDASAACVTERLDDDEARAVFVAEIDRAYDDPAQTDAVPFAELVTPVVDAYDACLSDDEQARIDFN
jgi:hypothetical protein